MHHLLKSISVTVASATLLCCATLFAGSTNNEQTIDEPPSPIRVGPTPKIERWIEQLSSRHFSEREEATAALIQERELAIDSLGRQTDFPDVESVWRILYVLETIANGASVDVENAVANAFAKLKNSKHPTMRAKAAIAYTKMSAAQRVSAIARLRNNGAQVSMNSKGVDYVTVGESYRGGAKGVQSLTRFPEIRKVRLSNPEISDDTLSILAALNELEDLRLYGTNIRGAGLVHLAGLPKLDFLSLKGLPIKADHLAPIAKCQTLAHLGLDDTKIGNEAMVHVGKLTKLKTLWINFTKVNDEGLAPLAKLPALNKILLAGAPINGEGLGHLAAIDSLKYISLQGTEFSKEGITQLAKLKQVDVLGLDESNIQDDDLRHVSGLTDLKVLWISSTDITDDGLKHLTGLKGLTRLHFANSKVTPAGIEELKKHLPKCEFE